MFPQRATAGLRRTIPELTDSNHDNNNPVDDSSTPTQQTDPVAMEISSSPPLTDLERNNLFSCHSQEVEKLQYAEVHGVEEEDVEGENEKRDGDECDYLVFEIGEQKGKEGEGDSEAQDAEKEEGGDEGEDIGREETEGDDGRRGEDGGRGEIEGEEGREPGEVEEKGEIDTEEEHRENVEGEDGCKDETESDDWGKREVEGEDEGREKTEGEEGESKEAEVEDEGKGDTKAEDNWREVGEMKEDAVSELCCISDGPLCTASSEPLSVTSDALEQPAAAMWQDTWIHNLGNRDDLSDGHLSDCLQAELAIVYSDSDAGEDQWAAFAPSDVTNQEDSGGGMQDGICDGEERQGEHYEADVETGTEGQREEEQEESREGRASDEEQMKTRRDLFLRSPSVSSTASSTDPDRRVRLFLFKNISQSPAVHVQSFNSEPHVSRQLPADFCVHQETHSDNVSTEHLDFLLARQQWKKMEEEVKGRPIPKPGLIVQGSFQGTHTSLYPPTRSPRLKHR